MLLIVMGLIIGAKQRFTGVGWLVMILVGTFFLLDDITGYHWHLYRYGLPVGIIIVGFFLLFKAVMKPSYGQSGQYSRDPRHRGFTTESGTETDEKKSNMNSFGEDFVDITNLLGGTKKRIFSKNFYGGDITNFFGGTDLDFTQADMKNNSVAMLDITQIFGGVKLIVPANWTIKSEMTTILGGFEDKRTNLGSQTEDSNKVLMISGTCIFGGVEIKSY